MGWFVGFYFLGLALVDCSSTLITSRDGEECHWFMVSANGLRVARVCKKMISY
jgi:hypothetical protein